MATASCKNHCSKSHGDKIVIPRDILNEIKSLPDKNNNQKVIFEKWEDDTLLKYGRTKSLKKIAEILNRKVTTVRERYRVLMRQNSKENNRETL